MSLAIRLITINFLLSFLLCPLQAIAEEPAVPPASPATQAAPPTSPSDEKGLVFSFSGEFDKYFFPSKLDFALPVFKLNIKDVHVNLSDLAFNFHKEITDKGLELANVSARAQQIFVQIPEEKASFKLENFETVTENQVQEDVINTTMRSQFARLTLPKQLTKTAEDLKLHYNSALEFHRLDAKSMLELQKYFYELRASGALERLLDDTVTQGKPDDTAAGMLGLSMLGKLGEIAPKMIARSPEMMINDLNLTSEHNEVNIVGHANLGVIGPPDGTPPKPDAVPVVEGAAKFEVHIEKNLLNTLLEDLGNAANYQEKIQLLVAEKLINDTGSHYDATLTADYKNNKLTMNKATETLMQILDTPPAANMDAETVAVTEAVDLMRNLSTDVAQQYQTTGKWVVTQKLSGATSGTHTAKIESNTKQLFLQATLKGIKEGVPAKIASKTVRFSYNAKDKTWKCEAGKPKGINPEYLPNDCR